MQKPMTPISFDEHSSMITPRSADFPVTLRASAWPMRATSLSALAEPFDRTCISSLPQACPVGSTESAKLKAIWIRADDRTLICRWVLDDAASIS